MSTQSKDVLKDSKTQFNSTAAATVSTSTAATAPNPIDASTPQFDVYKEQREEEWLAYCNRTALENLSMDTHWYANPYDTFKVVFQAKLKSYKGGNLYFFIPSKTRAVCHMLQAMKCSSTICQALNSFHPKECLPASHGHPWNSGITAYRFMFRETEVRVLEQHFKEEEALLSKLASGIANKK